MVMEKEFETEIGTRARVVYKALTKGGQGCTEDDFFFITVNLTQRKTEFVPRPPSSHSETELSNRTNQQP